MTRGFRCALLAAAIQSGAIFMRPGFKVEQVLCGGLMILCVLGFVFLEG